MNYRMPAEWNEHKGIIMQWPLFWKPGDLDGVRRSFVELAFAISRFEPVWMIVAPEAADGAREMLRGIARVLEVPHDDCWARDNGPIFVRDHVGKAAALDFGFNAWGRKYPSWDRDDAVPERLCGLWGVECVHVPMILEGGNICVNGAGTLITVSECLLNGNRNHVVEQNHNMERYHDMGQNRDMEQYHDMERHQSITRDEIERLLKNYLGVERIVWLPRGMYDDETDGHVDNVCSFIDEHTVLMQWTEDKCDPNYERQAENLDLLREAGLRVETIPAPPALYDNGELLTASYINFVYVNGGIVMPQFGGIATDADMAALERMRQLFPHRVIAPVLTYGILRGGGNIHCVTQQVIPL